MTERFNETVDYRRIDGLEVIKRADFKQWVGDINHLLSVTPVEGRQSIIDLAEEFIGQFFPHIDETEFIDGIAIAYELKPGQADYDANTATITSFSDTKLKGLDWVNINGQPQMVFNLQSKNNLELLPDEGGNEADNYTQHLVLPDEDSICDLEMEYLAVGEPSDAAELASGFTTSISELMLSSEFESASLEIKRQMLAERIDRFDGRLRNLLPYSESVDTFFVECDGYIVVPHGEDIPEADYSLYTMRAVDNEPIEVSGDEIGVILPEFAAAGVSRWWDLGISGGVPHIAIDDFEKKCSYWIPADQLLNIRYRTIEDDEETDDER